MLIWHWVSGKTSHDWLEAPLMGDWLVVWLPFLAFSHFCWECHHPNWLSYFSEGFKPPTRGKVCDDFKPKNSMVELHPWWVGEWARHEWGPNEDHHILSLSEKNLEQKYRRCGRHTRNTKGFCRGKFIENSNEFNNRSTSFYSYEKEPDWT